MTHRLAYRRSSDITAFHGKDEGSAFISPEEVKQIPLKKCGQMMLMTPRSSQIVDTVRSDQLSKTYSANEQQSLPDTSS